METTAPEDVSVEMNRLLKEYHKRKTHTLEELLDFHYRFERIHPFQDGNGRVGRLLSPFESLAIVLLDRPILLLKADFVIFLSSIIENNFE